MNKANLFRNHVESFSLRAYLAILYRRPRMKIYINGKKVDTRLLEHTLHMPRQYTADTSKFKKRFRDMIRQAQREKNNGNEMATCSQECLRFQPSANEKSTLRSSKNAGRRKEQRRMRRSVVLRNVVERPLQNSSSARTHTLRKLNAEYKTQKSA